MFCFFLFIRSITLLYSEDMSMLKAQRCERKTGFEPLSLDLSIQTADSVIFCLYGRAHHHGDFEYGQNLHLYNTSLEDYSAFSQVFGEG